MASELMNISVNGQSKVPPGFRFHPTEEELLHYYLKKKISLQKIDLDVIHEVDLNKLEPWDIQERCKIGTTTQTDWYFFSHKDKKYPSGTRTNRATAAGFWKATGRDKVIYSTSSRKIIGMRKTLVFYTGRAPHGQKSDWIMYEYRLDDSCTSIESQYLMASHNNVFGEGQQDEGWVVCRIFKKRNHQNKNQGYPNMASSSINNIGDPLFGEGKKVDNININNNDDNYLPNDNMFVKSHEYHNRVRSVYQQPCSCNNTNPNNGDGEILVGSNYEEESSSMVTKWSAVDQLVACQLNGQTVDQFDVHEHDPTYFVDHHHRHQDLQFQVLASLTDQSNYSQLCGLWGFTS